MRALRSVWLLCLCSVSIVVAQPAYKPAASRTLLRAGHVIDVHTHLTMAKNFDPSFELSMHPDAVDKLPAVTAALEPTRPQPRDDHQVNSF